MHDVSIPAWTQEYVMRRRGTLHSHAVLDPQKKALVVIDLQNAFMHEMAALPVARAVEIVPTVNKLAQVVRRAGGHVFWIRFILCTDDVASWSRWLGMLSPELRSGFTNSLKPGTFGSKLFATLDVHSQDHIVDKTRFSAFLPGASELPERLLALDCDTVIIAGTLTHVCCEASARDAVMLNFRTIMTSDATATHTDALHNASLTNFYTTFGDVMSSDQLIDCLSQASTRLPGGHTP